MEQTEQYLGKILKQRYEIERELGRGGIAVVYLARDLSLMSKHVVIKLLLEKSSQNQWLKQKFRQEIEALARVDHPSIVSVLDVGETDEGKTFYVMQFIEGVNLRSRMRAGGMDLRQVAHILKQVSQGLAAVHEKGVFHRDLKPENIMLQNLSGGLEQIKIIDFGIARVENSQMADNSSFTVVAGTTSYICPEQLMSKPYMATGDIFSMGVLAYEMLTGQLPFKPNSIFHLLYLQGEGVKVKPSRLRPELSSKVDDVILKALAFHPEHRYQNAMEFGEELSNALGFTGSLSLKRDVVEVVDQVDTLKVVKRSTVEIPNRILLVYSEDAKIDGNLALLLERKLLARGYDTSIYRSEDDLGKRLENIDFVVLLIGATSLENPLFLQRINLVKQLASQTGHLRIVPLRVSYTKEYPEELALLSDLEIILWRSQDDTERVVLELLSIFDQKIPAEVMASPVQHPSMPVQALETPGGAVPLDSRFYVERKTDEDFRLAIGRQDSIVLVKGPRQMGKTSLLARGLQQARQGGCRVVLTDFQKLSAEQLQSSEKFFLAVSELLADQLDLDVVPADVWNTRRGPSINFERFIRREVLSKVDSHLVWGMDEVDRLFGCPFASEVFGLFRSWHNERSLDPAGPWQRLTLTIAYATEAHLFITDLNQSPFNVGTRLVLEDFELKHVLELNERYGSPLHGREQAVELMKLVGGHPYLIRRSLHEMVVDRLSFKAFTEVATSEEGPFSEHLHRLLASIVRDTQIRDSMIAILQGRQCPGVESFYRLRSTGAISGDSSRTAVVRCRLYEDYLKKHLLGG